MCVCVCACAVWSRHECINTQRRSTHTKGWAPGVSHLHPANKDCSHRCKCMCSECRTDTHCAEACAVWQMGLHCSGTVSVSVWYVHARGQGRLPTYNLLRSALVQGCSCHISTSLHNEAVCRAQTCPFSTHMYSAKAFWGTAGWTLSEAGFDRVELLLSFHMLARAEDRQNVKGGKKKKGTRMKINASTQKKTQTKEGGNMYTADIRR